MLQETISPLTSESERISTEDAIRHEWKEANFSSITFCSLCDKMITTVNEKGISCNECAFTVHARCLEKTPDVCPERLLDIDMTLLPKLSEKPPPRCLEKNYPRLIEALLYPAKMHTFRAHRYTKPTCCTVCSKMLSGARSQGMKCIDCDYNIHAQCYNGLRPCCVKPRLKPQKRDPGLVVQPLGSRSPPRSSSAGSVRPQPIISSPNSDPVLRVSPVTPMKKQVSADNLLSVSRANDQLQQVQGQSKPEGEQPPPRPKRAKSASTLTTAVNSERDLEAPAIPPKQKDKANTPRPKPRPHHTHTHAHSDVTDIRPDLTAQAVADDGGYTDVDAIIRANDPVPKRPYKSLEVRHSKDRPASTGSIPPEPSQTRTFSESSGTSQNTMTIGTPERSERSIDSSATGVLDGWKWCVVSGVYVEEMNKKEAEAYLTTVGGDEGDYVVRSSASRADSITVSFVTDERVCHTRIHKDGSKVYIVPSKKFDSVAELLEFHHTEPIELHSKTTENEVSVALNREFPIRI